MTLLRSCALSICFAALSSFAADSSLGPNALTNGGFESGEKGWWHPRGSYAGQIDPGLRHGGVASWRIDLARTEQRIHVSHGGGIERGRGHQVSVSIRCKDVTPQNAITIRVLQFARGKPVGWALRAGQEQLIHTGGSHGWHPFSVNIADDKLKPTTERLTIFLEAAANASGTVWFDDVSLRDFTGKPPAELLDAQAAPPLDLAADIRPDAAAAFRDIPFLDNVGDGVTISCGSDHNLVYSSDPAHFTIQVAAPAGAELHWIVSDYYGRAVKRGKAAATTVVAVPDFGYFEVAARLQSNGKQIAAARTSFAHLPAHPFPLTSPEYCFGSWVQQRDLLDDVGARWTRVGTGWRYLEPKKSVFRDKLWQGLDRSMDELAKTGIRPIFLFAKVPRWAGPHYKRVAPDHWEDFRAHVRRCVQRYGEHVDVWEVMNEPYIPTLFPGTLDEVMQWHRIVREEVDRHDPGAQVIGPCLNTRSDYLFEEERQLLELGIGKLIDGISIHTYGGLEAAGYLAHFGKLRELHARFHHDKPIYITEQGLSVPEELPLERVQAQYLARMVLLCMEARIKAVIWHMMSWPQGGSAEQRDFAIVRARKGPGQRAPRPAFVAAATVASVLGKARYVRRIEGLGDTVRAQLYEADGEPIVAIWDWGRPERQLRLRVGAASVKVVSIVGAARTMPAQAGVVRLTVGPDPSYVLGAEARALANQPRPQ